MPYCIRCGSSAGESDCFCSTCGQILNGQPSFKIGYSHKNFPFKQSTNLANGIMIGSGVSLIIVGALIAVSVNAIYNQQTRYLASMGTQVNTFGFGFDNVVFLISLGALTAMLGAYAFILGSIAQFSPVARAAWARKDTNARLGNGLITGGFIFASTTSLAFIREVYQPTNSGLFEILSLVFVTSGLMAIAVGALLIRHSYLRSLSPTKV